MLIAARYAFVVLAWAFVVGVIVQVFFIGLGLFGEPNAIGTHVEFGWILHLSPILLVVAAALARAGRRRILQTVALFVVVFVVPLVPALRESAPWLAALHPVLALFAFGGGIAVAVSATRLVMESRASAGSAAAA